MVSLSYSSLCIYWKWPQSLRKLQLVSVLAAGFLIHFSLGSLYTYGNLAPYIVSYVREKSHPQSLRYTDATFILGAQIAGQGTSMALGGWLEKRFGPRLVALFGGWFMSLGVLLSYLTIQKSFWLLLLTYGVMFGLGIGIAYTGPLACAMRWLPKWKGVAAGIIVSGFGLSALFFDVVQTLYINPNNDAPDSFPYIEYPYENYFTQSEVLDQVPKVFLLLGSIYFLLQVVGSIFLVNPPPDDQVIVEYQPMSELGSKNGNTSRSTSVSFKEKDVMSSDAKKEASRKEIIKKRISCTNFKADLALLFKNPKFYILWTMFFCVGIVSTLINALFKSFGFEFVTPDDHFLSLTACAGALFNFIGRIFWGFVADVTDYNFAFISEAAIVICFISTLFGASIGGKGLYFIWICAILFCIGGTYALFPNATVYIFGNENVSLYYGFLFTAAASGSIIGSFISRYLARIINWYGIFFLLSGIHIIELCLVFLL